MSFKLTLINPPAGAKTWYTGIGTLASPELSVLESWQCSSKPDGQYFFVQIYDALGTRIGRVSNIGPVTYSEGVIWTYDYQLNSIMTGSVPPSTTSPTPTATNPTPSIGASQYSKLQLKSVSPASVIAGGAITINAIFYHSGASESKYLLASITKNGVLVKGNIASFTVQNDGSSQVYTVSVSIQIPSDMAPDAYDIKLDITDGVFYTPVATVTSTAALVVNAPAPSAAPTPTPAASPSGGTSTLSESQIDSIKVVSVSPGQANPGSRVNINCALTHIGAGETIKVYAAIGNAHAVGLGGFDEYFAGQVTVNIPAHSSKTTLSFSVPVDLGDMNPGSYDAYCKILGAILPILTSPFLNLCIQVLSPGGVTPTTGPTPVTSPKIPTSTGSTGNTGVTPVTKGGTVTVNGIDTEAANALKNKMTWIILAVVAALALAGGHEKKEESGSKLKT
jgi:hypothetical protein